MVGTGLLCSRLQNVTQRWEVGQHGRLGLWDGAVQRGGYGALLLWLLWAGVKEVAQKRDVNTPWPGSADHQPQLRPSEL